MTPEQIAEAVKLIGRAPSQVDGLPLIEEAVNEGFIKAVSYGTNYATYKVTILGFEATNLDPKDVYI